MTTTTKRKPAKATPKKTARKRATTKPDTASVALTKRGVVVTGAKKKPAKKSAKKSTVKRGAKKVAKPAGAQKSSAPAKRGARRATAPGQVKKSPPPAPHTDPVPTPVPGYTPPDMSPSPARWLAYVHRTDVGMSVYVAREDGTGTTRLTFTTSFDAVPTWTPDGKHVVFASNRSGQLLLYVIEVATGALRQLPTPGLTRASSPAVSPDGLTLAFEGSATTPDATDVFVMPLDGSAPPQQLTATPQTDSCPSWSPDGATLYFLSNRGGSWELWAMDPDGANPRQLTFGANMVGRPAVSPDGAVAYFQRPNPDNTGRLVRRDLASQADTVLDPSGADQPNNSDPAVRPDGKALAVSSNRFGRFNYEIAVLEATSGELVTRATSQDDTDTSPAWGPRIG